MDTKLPKRKANRLQEYDYAQNGAYFVTICTQGKQKILCDIVGDDAHIVPSNYGRTVERYVQTIPGIEKYVIMPNHIHMLVRIFETGGHRGPPLHKVIGQFKSFTTHRYKKILWQRSFHDHVVRGEQDYREIWQYIDENPQKWQEDCFFVEEDIPQTP